MNMNHCKILSCIFLSNRAGSIRPLDRMRHMIRAAACFFLLAALGCTQLPVAPSKTEKPIITTPSNAYYFYLESQLMKKQGKIDAALQNLQKAIALDSESIYLQQELAAIYLHQKDSENALKVIEEILKKQPENLEALVLYGRLKQILKDLDAARGAYEKILSLDPDRQDIYLLLGELHLTENNLDAAFEVYSRLVRNQPQSYAGYFFLGKIHQQRQQWDSAEKMFLKSLELEPDLEEPRFELLSIYEQTGKVDLVIQTYQDILQQNPQHVRASMELGSAYLVRGMYDDADALLVPLGQRSQWDSEVIRKLIELYLTPKKYDLAVEILTIMLKGVPQSSELHYLLAVAYRELEQLDSALENFLAVKPDSSFYQNAAFQIAFIYQQQGKLQDTIDMFKKVHGGIDKIKAGIVGQIDQCALCILDQCIKLGFVTGGNSCW